ncbi:hypothetical protein P4K44_33700 [Bacillus cereus]|uniref:hypothetical protein n=1 Tax=Bacillus pumilus TaxID=1408 RepID=UPI002DB9F5EA|nr:hypothetical protein [Bacillus pumilus]MEB9770454.1 hypothetical protein [Bacillus cereus]MED1527894.1 hypothetical protein [Bacillus pumilus]
MALEWISAVNDTAYISLDKQGRIYVNSAARSLIGLPSNAPFHLTIGYDAEAGCLVVAKPEKVKTEVQPFKFDKRAYSKAARRVLEGAGLEDRELPLRLYLIGDGEASKQSHLAYPKGTYAFSLS